MILQSIETPADIKDLTQEQLLTVAEEIRSFIIESVTTTGGHLGSNLGAVELTLAVHRVFDSPRDVILWDTGHQAYVHKLLTGRRFGFKTLKQAGGMSGYPNRAESEHDWIENSHASTALSYAHGIAKAFALRGEADERKVIAVVGDGALTGGMTYEALNNLGHSGCRVVVVLNDNGRSYAPTVSQLSQSLTSLRLNPTYTQTRERLRNRLRGLPAFGPLAYTGVHSVATRAAGDGDPAHLLRSTRGALRRAHRRARRRADGAGLRQRGRMGRADRRARPHPERPRLRAGRAGRHPAPARREGDQGGRARERRSGARPGPPSAAPPGPTWVASPARARRRTPRPPAHPCAPLPTPTPSPAPCCGPPRTTRAWSP